MVRCSFCGQMIPSGTGKMFVRRDARIVYYCSRKCEKNQEQLGRKARNFKWTTSYTKGEQQ